MDFGLVFFHAHVCDYGAQEVGDAVEAGKLDALGVYHQHTQVVGRERVIAGADCGFSSSATFSPEVDPKVVWAKFQALAEGARLASQRLW